MLSTAARLGTCRSHPTPPLLGRGGLAAFFSHAAPVALTIFPLMLSGVALLSGCNLRRRPAPGSYQPVGQRCLRPDRACADYLPPTLTKRRRGRSTGTPFVGLALVFSAARVGSGAGSGSRARTRGGLDGRGPINMWGRALPMGAFWTLIVPRSSRVERGRYMAHVTLYTRERGRGRLDHHRCLPRQGSRAVADRCRGRGVGIPNKD